MRRMMWITNRRRGMWIPAPRFNPDYSREGSFEEVGYRNGGKGLKRSTVGARVYQLTWNTAKRELLQPILDYALGVFGVDRESRKPLPVWIVDPMAADRNVFNPSWATPSLAFGDALPLIEDQEPRLVPTPPNPFGYPVDQAAYVTDGASEKFFIPLPPDHTIWVGAHGQAGINTGVEVAGVKADGVLEPEMLPMMGYTQDLVSTPFGDPSWLGVEVSIRSSGSRKNLFLDPGFDADYGQDKKYRNVFTGPNGQANAYVFGKGYGGSRKSVVFTQEYSTTGPGNGIYANIEVEPGRIYSFGGWVWSNQLTRMAVNVTWYNLYGGVVGQTANGPASRIPTSIEPWQFPVRLERANVLSPSNAVRARVSFVTVEGDGFMPSAGLIDTDEGHQFALASLSANLGSKVLPYKDGDSPGWKWSGIPYNSVSVETVSRITLGALVAQVLPAGQTPARGNFPSGQGAGGLEFRGFPAETPYSATLNLVGMSATLVETQPWD